MMRRETLNLIYPRCEETSRDFEALRALDSENQTTQDHHLLDHWLLLHKYRKSLQAEGNTEAVSRMDDFMFSLLADE